MIEPLHDHCENLNELPALLRLNRPVGPPFLALVAALARYND
jgi:hypothetical protein